MNGKGSRPRPTNGEKYRENYERVFGRRANGVSDDTRNMQAMINNERKAKK